jgi:hypothetical protein
MQLHPRRSLDHGPIDPSAEPDDQLHLIGRANDGKTIQLCGLVEHLIGMGGEDLRDRVRLVNLNAGLVEALEDLKKGKWPDKTGPGQLGEPAEQLRVQHRGRVLAINAHPGEVLRSGGGITPETPRQLFGDRDLIAVVVNAFRYNEGISVKSLLGLIATLQAPPLNHDLLKATAVAYDLLFGIKEAGLQQREIDYQEVAHCQGVTLRWDPLAAGGEGRFTADHQSADAAPDSRPLFRALSNLAQYAVRQDLDINNLRQFIRHHPGVIVVLTRLDLLPLIPALAETDFHAIFEDAFGPGADHWASQRVLARNIRLILRPDAARTVRIADIDTSGGKQLWSAISRALERQHDRDEEPQPDGAGLVLRAAKEALVRLPLVGLFALLALWIAYSQASPWFWAHWSVWAFAAFTVLELLRAPARRKRPSQRRTRPATQPTSAPNPDHGPAPKSAEVAANTHRPMAAVRNGEAVG